MLCNAALDVHLRHFSPSETLRMPMTYKKKSSTIVLIGDSGSNKTHVLQLLYAACLGTDAEKFFSLKDELPSPGKVVGGSSFYTIQQTDGTELNVLDTPELGDTDDENKATEITHAIKSLVTTIDAVVVVADHAKTVLSAAVVQTLKAIFFLFPRPIKGTYFLPTNPANTDPSFDLAWENYSSWFLEDQFFGSVENIVDLRRDLQARHAKPSSVILKAFSKSFGRALQTLRGLLQEVESSSIEAWDIKHLYLRATKIESSIHHALSPGDGTSAHSDDPTPTTARKVRFCLVRLTVTRFNCPPPLGYPESGRARRRIPFVVE